MGAEIKGQTRQGKTLPSKEVHLPGEAGIWLFIAGDLLLFSLLFILYLKYRAADEALFNTSQQLLNQQLGLVNTLLMLTSSWLVASAVKAARRDQIQLTFRCLGLAFACGAVFVAVKYVEYSEKISMGWTPISNDFFMYYYVYTGIHLIHVFIGLGVLALMMQLSRFGTLGENQMRTLESGVSFWHLVDLLWIILFALLYLVGQ